MIYNDIVCIFERIKIWLKNEFVGYLNGKL